MNYDAAVRFLLSLGRELAAPTQAAAAKFDLENITLLSERLGRPDRAYPSAHIAGTNGKGSTAAFLESILRQAGFRTGLNTSPHLEKINERIRVDFGVFEVGLGGRLDATNILAPAISLITTIDFDHENFLGHSLSDIATEKAGILKKSVPVVLARQRPEAREVLLARATKLGCPIIETAEAYRLDDGAVENSCAHARITEVSTGWSARLAPQLPGRFQLQNAMNAVAAARTLAARGYRVPQDSIEQGIASAVWPGRLEKLQSRPDIYVDGAHNPGAARELAAFWQENFAGRKIFLLYGALRDKAVDEIAGLLFPHAAEVVFTEAGTSRAISASQLSEIAAHLAARSSVIPDAEQAFDYLVSEARPEDAVFVTGSLYLVGRLRHYWKQRAQVAAG